MNIYIIGKMENIPFMWEVEHDGNVSYLMGTEHIMHEDILLKAQEVIAKARVLMVETPEDFRLRDEHILLPEGQTIDNFLGSEEVDKLNQFLRPQYERFLPPDRIMHEMDKIQRQKLWYLESHVKSIFFADKEIEYYGAKKRAAEIKVVFEQRPLPPVREIAKLRDELYDIVRIMQDYESKINHAPPTLDNAIRGYAKSSGIKVIGLDQPDEYVMIHDSVSTETQKKELLATLDSVRIKKPDEFKSANYKIGDDEGIVRELSEHKELMDKVCHGRTAIWYPRTVEQIQRGNAVVAVGIAHLLTDRGYVALLQKDGYAVRRL